MRITAAAADLAHGYEALRAQAVGEIPTATPRGLAVLIHGGLPSWMRAFAPTSQPRPSKAQLSCTGRALGLTSLNVELVGLLTDMALSSQRKYDSWTAISI